MSGLNIEQFFQQVQEVIKALAIEAKATSRDKATEYVDEMMSLDPQIQNRIAQMVQGGLSQDAQKVGQEIFTKYQNHMKTNTDRGNRIPNLNVGQQDAPNPLNGEGALNQMERKVMNFTQFINEQRS